MLRLSKLTDYAVVVLIRLGDCQRAGENFVQTSPGIATATGVPEPTVAKVLKALAAATMVTSQRGARGGECDNKRRRGVCRDGEAEAEKGHVRIYAGTNFSHVTLLQRRATPHRP